MRAAMIRQLSALALAAVLAACGGNATVPENHFYRLEVAPPETKGKLLMPGVLEVDRLLAAGELTQRSIVYRNADNPHQMRAYHYHFWNEAPGVLLQAELINYLNAAGIAGKVLTPEMRARPDFAITGRVEKLERVIGGSNAGVIEMNLVLRRVNDGTVLVAKTYTREFTPKDDGLTALVKGFSGAARDIFKAFVNDIAAQI
jgi:cholesterol transport system auxiliary component